MFHIFKKKTLTEEEQAKKEHEKYIQLKAKVQEYPKFIKALIVFLFALLFLLSYTFPGEFDSSRLVSAIERFTFIALPLVIIVFTLEEADISESREEIYKYDLTHNQQEAQEDPFKNAIKTSYTYLDRYYDQTQQQAKNGFRITMGVALFGAGLISVGVWLLFSGINDKITPAYITCASGVITEFISSIFFAMYNKTVTSMNSYHDKLVLSQNIAFALRVADSLENNKDAAKLEIIKELMKDVNAQMMKSDNDDAEPPKKKQSDAEKPSDAETQS